MRVLMLTTNSSLLDGINRHILTIAPTLNEKTGIEVAVCTVFKRGKLHELLEASGVRTFSLKAPHGHSWRVLCGFYKVMRDYAPDVVHVHVFAVFEQIVSAVFFRKCKYVKTIHGLCGPLSFVDSLMQIFGVSFSTAIFVSRGVQVSYLSVRKSFLQQAVIYNPIGISARTNSGSLHKRLNIRSSVPIIGTACRIAAVKNPLAFTRIMCNVLDRIPVAHAVVMGNGVTTILSECESIVASRKLGERFHFLGNCPEAPAMIAELSCFVMTSSDEGMPTAVLEAMSARVPVALWKGEGGLKDLVAMNVEAGPFAEIAEQGDEDGLTAKIATLLGNESRRRELGENALKVITSHFDVAKVSEQIRQVYLCAK